MVNKRSFKVFRILFYLKDISNQDDILQEEKEALARVLLKETKLNISR